MQPRWERYANDALPERLDSLCLDPTASRGWTTSTASCARSPASRPRPSAATFRRSSSSTACATASSRRPSPSATADQLDYLPEPDIFHDIAGHVPMHTDQAFAETLVRFGECAHTAADIVAGDSRRARAAAAA